MQDGDDAGNAEALFESTVEHNLIMIIEQNVSQFVQLAPCSPSEVPVWLQGDDNMSSLKRRMCRPFPFDFIDHSSGAVLQSGVSNFSYSVSGDGLFYTAYFQLSALVTQKGSSEEPYRKFLCFSDGAGDGTCSRGSASLLAAEVVSVDVEYIWFKNWTDFEPPADDAIEVTL